MKPPHNIWTEALGDEAAARDLWTAVGAAGGEPATCDVDAAWARFEAAAGASAPDVATEPAAARVLRLSDRARSRRRKYLRYAYAAAAAVALLVAMNLLAGIGETDVEFANATALDMPVRLPDDSEATLTPGSRLQYAERDGRREVTMAGAVAFDVRALGGMAFAVSAEELDIIVVGTAFSVNDGGVAGVDVAEGHVRVRGRREADWTDVYAGGYARVSDGLVTSVRAQRQVSGALQFRDATTAEVLAALAETHGRAFTADTALSGCRVTVNLQDTSPRDAAATLAAVLGAEVTAASGGFHLRGGACG